ncbi:MAG: amidohydrolase family protein [Gammaproteobacteria bacterium]|nr:amidohydrolase family protein [Gammaproteobacteria bacterium]
MRTLIEGGWVVATRNGGHVLHAGGAVVFEGDTIIHAGGPFDGAVDRTIDARGMLVCPGFIDTHVHFGTRALHRLFSDTGRPEFYGQPFLEVQIPRDGTAVANGETIDRLSGQSPAERLDLEAEYTVAELLRSGITTFVEFGSRRHVQRRSSRGSGSWEFAATSPVAPNPGRGASTARTGSTSTGTRKGACASLTRQSSSSRE